MILLKEPMHYGEVLRGLYRDPLEMGPLQLQGIWTLPATRSERLVNGVTSLAQDADLHFTHTQHDTSLLDEHANQL